MSITSRGIRISCYQSYVFPSGSLTCSMWIVRAWLHTCSCRRQLETLERWKHMDICECKIQSHYYPTSIIHYMKVTESFPWLHALTRYFKSLGIFHFNFFSIWMLSQRSLPIATDCIFNDFSHCGVSVSLHGSFLSLSIEKNKIFPNGNISHAATLRQENIKTRWRQEIKTGCRFKNRISENRLASILL